MPTFLNGIQEKRYKIPRTNRAHEALFRLAANQAGHFTAEQARGLGVTDDLLHHYVTSGRFLRRRRAVYRLRDFPESRFEDLAELILAAGAGAALSHETALLVNDLTDLLPTVIHITVPRGSKRRVSDPRVRMHRHTLERAEIRRVNGLTATTVTRALRDVAGRIDPEQFDLAVRDALAQGLTDRRKLRAVVGAAYGRTWRALHRYLRTE